MDSTLTVDEFRADFSEFDLTTYPEAVVQFWLDRAEELHSYSRSATYMLCAHLLKLWEIEGGDEIRR